MLCTLPVLQAPPSWSSSARCGNSRHTPLPEDDLEPRPAVPASLPEIAEVRHASFVFSLHRFTRNYKSSGWLRWEVCFPYLDGFAHERVATGSDEACTQDPRASVRKSVR